MFSQAENTASIQRDEYFPQIMLKNVRQPKIIEGDISVITPRGDDSLTQTNGVLMAMQQQQQSTRANVRFEAPSSSMFNEQINEDHDYKIQTTCNNSNLQGGLSPTRN